MNTDRWTLLLAVFACGTTAFRLVTEIADSSGWEAVLFGVAAYGWLLIGTRVFVMALERK